jgi:hypothetical protein
MDNLRAYERSLEEEWIAKYRAALQAVPCRETWEDRMRNKMRRAYDSFTSNAQEIKGKIMANKTVIRWVQFVQPNCEAAVSSTPQFSVIRTLQSLTPKKFHSVGVHDHRARKAG